MDEGFREGFVSVQNVRVGPYHHCSLARERNAIEYVCCYGV